MRKGLSFQSGLLMLCLVLVVGLTSPSILFAACVVEQTQDTSQANYSNPKQGQSFTATCDGVIITITVNIMHMQGSFPMSATLYIYNGESVAEGDLLHTQSDIIISGTGDKTITLTSPVNVTSGNQYTYILIFEAANRLGLRLTTSGSYAGGKAYALNAFQDNIDMKFNVSIGILPTVTTTDINNDNVTTTTAINFGNISDQGESAVIDRGFCYSTSTPAIDGTCTPEGGTGTGAFSKELTGLASNTLYYFQAYATNSQGTAYGSEKTFTTLAEPASHVAITGPATILNDGVGGYTLTALDASDNPSNVDQDTVFDLTSTGSGTFYSDAAGTTAITQKTIVNGASTATVYYRDDTFDAPTLTASVDSGQTLDDGNKQIGIKGNNALFFNAGSYVDVGAGPGSTQTVEFWVYPHTTTEYFIDLDGGTHFIWANAGTLTAAGFDSPTIRINGKEGTAIEANIWQHVSVTTATGFSASDFDIGRKGSDSFFGFIDEVRVWSDVRTEAEIRANMHRELQGNEDGLAAYYKLDNGTGTTAYDSGPKGHDGTLTDGPLWYTSGAMSGPGNALDFDGTDDYVEILSSPTLTSGTFSVEFWMKMTGQTEWGGIIDHGAYQADGDHYNWQFLTYDGQWKIIFGITKNDAGQWSEVTADVTQDKWHHVAGIYDGTTMSLYLDGVLIDTLATTIRTADKPIFIGKRVDQELYFKGQIDEVRIWNTARTPAQIRDDMAKSMQGDEPGLVAYYRMDQQEGTKLYDISPNGNNGDLNGGPSWVESEVFNTWIGVTTVWNSALNWSRSAVPVATDNIGIPDYSDVTGYPAGKAPTISGSPTVNHFVLATDAGSTLSSNLTANGNLLLNSTFGVGANTVTVTGTTANTNTLSIGAGTLECNGDYDASGGSTTFTGGGMLKLGGDYDLGTFTKGTGRIFFDGTEAQSITGDFNPYTLIIANAAGVDASGATSLKVDDTLLVQGGTFTSKSDYHDVIINSGATLALSGDITVSGDWTNQNGGTFTHNNHKVTLDGANQSLSGTTTFYDLSKTVASAATLTFPAGVTTTITNALTLQGAAGQLLSLRSSNDGTQWNIDPQGTRTIGYLDVKDSNNIDATNMGAEDDNCADSGNNVNWFNYSAPTVTTEPATDIGTTTATGNGNITSLGIPSPTAHGVCWATSADPTTDDDCTDKGAASATGAFTADITGLSPGTTYHVRAFATNDVDTVYGDDVEFTTDTPPGTYTLTVTKGTGGGNYAAERVVSIAANAPEEDWVFVEWIGAGAAHVDNVNNPNTTVTMPAEHIAVEATYKEQPPATHTLTVTNGSGGGAYKEGAVANIAADPQEDKVFDAWTGDTTHVANVNIPNTTVIMPASNVTVTATYKDKPAQNFTLTVTSGTGGGAYPAGRVVRIEADDAPADQIFDIWTGDTARLTDVNSPDTTITMPDANVALTATYRDKPNDPFNLTVTNGTGGGNYVAGSVREIKATIPGGQIFDKWTGQTGRVANPNLPETTVTMPASNVTVTATFMASGGAFTLEQRIYKEDQAEAAPMEPDALARASEFKAADTRNPGAWYAITADNEPGYDFFRWEGQTHNVEDVNKQSTRIYMPAENVVLVAVYTVQGSSASLADAAFQHCKTDGEAWFASADAANANRRLVFPYVPGTVYGWWSGYALINTHATRNIPQAGLCLAAVNEAGDGFGHVLDKPLFTGNFLVGMVDAMDPDEERWNDRLAMGVFKKPDVDLDDGDLSGFVFMGDQVQGAGYFADNRQAQAGLAFDYVPGLPWWRGLAVLNDHGAETAYVRVAVYQANGQPVILESDDRIKIAPGRMMVGILDDLIAGLDPEQRARIELHAETQAGAALNALHGFILIGDWSQATGYLGTGIP